MTSKEKRIPTNDMILTFLIGVNIVIMEAGYTTGQKWYGALAATIPALILAILNNRQK